MGQLVYFMLVIGVGLVGCSNLISKNAVDAEPSPGVSQETKIVSNIVDPRTDFPDFENFRYPYICSADGGGTEPFVLTNGSYKNSKEHEELGFLGVTYADVTGDGKDEAIVVLDVITGGSSMPNCVYVFARNDQDLKRPGLLGDFYTGDRADGGLRSIYRENGSLIVEQYSYEDNLGDCCQKYYLRKIFNWEKQKFKKTSEDKIKNPIRGTEIKVGKH